MGFGLYPSLVMWKVVVLELVWVPAELVAPSEVEKPVPTLGLILVFWGYSDPENFRSESMAAVVTRIIFVSVVEICFCEICGKSD